MPTVTAFESREAKLNNEIEAQVKQIRERDPLELPNRNAAIVDCYVQKIEGTYNVARAKKDTDNAIDLLYIAYNTTPQNEGEIRVKISGIMDGLLKAQADSERTMARAMRIADGVLGDLNNYLPDWLDVKEGKDMEEMKNFVKSDLLTLAGKIKAQALSIREELCAVAAAYDGLIKQTAAATATSEVALGKRLDAKAKIEEEINTANADRERIESLVADLKTEVDKFDKLAKAYEERAKTAEERAFIMSIVRVGAQVVSAALPAVAMAAGGPGSVLAASTLGRTPEVKDDASGASGKSGAKSDSKADDTEDAIKTRKDISENKAKLEDAKKKVESLTDKKKKLKKELDDKAKQNPKKAAAAKTPASTKDPKGTQPVQPDDEDEITEDDSEAEKAVKERLQEANKELKEEQEKVSALTTTLLGLKASLDALEKGLSKLTEDQQSQAANLYQLQMQMLDKADQYEKERRTQSAELVKITALLKGQRSRQETIQLCVKSLNLSLSALKRTKEIIEEIAFFFKSFADFMQAVGTEAVIQTELLQKTAASEKKLGSYALKNLLLSTDEFFIRQAGEWHATWFVAEKFNHCFDSGWSKLNKLSGKYITGDELAAYLKTAAELLESIVAERESAAHQKIVAIEAYRQRISQGIAA